GLRPAATLGRRPATAAATGPATPARGATPAPATAGPTAPRQAATPADAGRGGGATRAGSHATPHRRPAPQHRHSGTGRYDDTGGCCGGRAARGVGGGRGHGGAVAGSGEDRPRGQAPGRASPLGLGGFGHRPFRGPGQDGGG